MHRLSTRILLAALVGCAFVPAPTRAQLPDGWTFSIEAHGGGLIPLRQLGKNAGTIPQVPVLQVVADRQNSGVVGGGIALTSASGETTIRARFTTTLDGVVSGRLGVCGDPDNPLFEGALCQPVETASDVRSFAVDMGFLQGSAGDRIRASLHIGAGLRKYSFGTIDCNDPTDWQVICEFTSEIWQDQGGISPFLMGGIRLNGNLGPAVLWVEGMDYVGRYTGGSDRADGNVQNDIAVIAGLSVRVF